VRLDKSEGPVTGKIPVPTLLQEHSAMIQIMRAKLHGIRVTGAELDYHGSITLDPDICDQAGLLPLEFVEIWNKSSGARITTYVIHGIPGSRCCILNGAAARTCQVDDELIICASSWIAQPDELYTTRPTVLCFGPGNQVDEIMHYDVKRSATRAFDFSVHSEYIEGARALHTIELTALRGDLKARGLDDLAISDLIARHLSGP